ncbi:ABC transporter permease subunit [candidate division KSB3 bacterium]|uniref:ABC transporter permease subunit n=1 Tax=candidate division KSB3 bacterium TaxID=2044937 RepID=A0A9D5Q5V7_9BACT|nr:ABC transporter permease subunit [candidate division KSB3 bacterium]MBD3324642.1 ABC transporter permease subunit [candidate division KSB3 bacterium]
MMTERKFSVGTVVVILIIVMAVIWTLFPLYYLFLTSVKPANALFESPPRLVITPSLETYDKILIQEQFYKFFLNSFLIAVGASLLALAIAAPATFAFTQWEFRGKESLFFTSLIGRMFPPVTTLIPIYLMLKFLQLLDTHLGLILIYAAFLIPLVLLILREFFGQVPKEICECARLDGASSFQVFLRIVLPLSINGLIAAGTLCFVEAWNEFLFALVLTSFTAKTAPVVLATFVENEGMIQWGALAALGVCTVLPTVLFMIFLHKFLIKGLTLGSLKG